MDEQVALPVRVLECPHIPFLDRLTLVEDWPVECIFSVNSLARRNPYVRVLVAHVVTMHQHDVFTRLRATHHLASFPHAFRTEYSILLHRQDNAPEHPVAEVVRHVATKSRESVRSVRLPFAKQIVFALLLDDASAMSIYRLSVLVKPRHTVDNSLRIS